MAQLVLGMGMSHSTMVTLDDSLWGEWAAQDSTFAILFDTEGQAVTYAQLAERAGGRSTQPWERSPRPMNRLASDMPTKPSRPTRLTYA